MELRSSAAADSSSREESLSEVPRSHREQHQHLEQDHEQDQDRDSFAASRAHGPDHRPTDARASGDGEARRMPPPQDTAATQEPAAQDARAEEADEQEQAQRQGQEQAYRADGAGGGRGAAAVLSANAWALVAADALAAAFAALSLSRLSPAKGDGDAADAPLWPGAVRAFGCGLMFLLALDYLCGYTFPAHFPA
jgi:hypothetical protein